MDNPETLATLDTQHRRRKKNYNTICVGYHYAQINTTNVNKTRGKYANGLLCKKKEMYSINFFR